MACLMPWAVRIYLSRRGRRGKINRDGKWANEHSTFASILSLSLLLSHSCSTTVPFCSTLLFHVFHGGTERSVWCTYAARLALTPRESHPDWDRGERKLDGKRVMVERRKNKAGTKHIKNLIIKYIPSQIQSIMKWIGFMFLPMPISSLKFVLFMRLKWKKKGGRVKNSFRGYPPIRKSK